MARSGLRGASAEALAALTPRVEATSGDEAAQLGADLFGIAAVLRAEPSLRRVATDVSTDAAAKSGLVRQLFEGKVSQPALDLLADAVERRWTATRDLADTIEDGATGFLVDAPTPAALLEAAGRAVAARRRRGWRTLRMRCMREDHSWTRSAGDYERLYHLAIGALAP